MIRKKLDWQWLLLLLTPIALTLFLTTKIQPLKWDVEIYLNLAHSLTNESGQFSLLNIQDNFRGVLYALYLYAAEKISLFLHADIRMVILVLHVILLGVMLCTIFTLFQTETPGIKPYASKLKCLHMLAIFALLVVFARYCFTTLLTDFPALFCTVLGIYCFYKARHSTKWRFVWAFLAGMLLYTAYNFRTIYLFSAVVLVLIELFLAIVNKEKGWALVLIAFFAGALLAGIPQMIVNYNLHGIFSVQLMARPADDPGQNLFVDHLFWGISMQRYDSNIGVGPEASFPFRWPGAENILRLEFERTIPGYFKLVLSHPLYFVGLYLAHFLNMLSPYFPDVYITNVLATKWPYLLAMYTLCYLVVWDISSKFASGRYTLKGLCKERCLYLLVLLAPVAAILPGAVEQRFGLPLFCLLFYYFVTQCSWKILWEKIKINPVGNVMLYGFLLAMMFEFWIGVLATAPIPLPL